MLDTNNAKKDINTKKYDIKKVILPTNNVPAIFPFFLQYFAFMFKNID